MITSTHYHSLPHFPENDLPIRLHEGPSNGGILRSVSLGAALTILLVAPPAIIYLVFLLVEADFSSLSETSYRHAAAFMAVVATIAAFGKRFSMEVLQRTGRHRTTTINQHQVTVRERSLFGNKEWSEPLSDYSGVRSQTRVTAKGRQEELILSHPQSNRQVSLWIGEEVPNTLVAGYKALLSRSGRINLP